VNELSASGIVLVCVAVPATASSRQCDCRTPATAACSAAGVGTSWRISAVRQTRETFSADASSAPPVRSRHRSNRLRIVNSSGETRVATPCVRNQRLNSLPGSYELSSAAS
jgi:hypothetical protein